MRFSQHLCPLFLMLIMADTSTFGQAAKSDSANAPPENGVYVILRHAEAGESSSRLGENERIVAGPHNSKSPEDNNVLVISDRPQVQLILAEEPQLQGEDGAQRLMLNIKGDETRKNLRILSKMHLNQRVAIVVDGQVVMTPKVRSVIKDGTLQISTCNVDIEQLKSSLWPTPQVPRHQ